MSQSAGRRPELDRSRILVRPWLPVSVAAATGLITGLAIYAGSPWLGLPDTPVANALFHDIPPGGLRLFLGLVMPIAACLPSLALSLLMRLLPLPPTVTPTSVLRLDLASSLALLVLVLLAAAWRHLPHSFVLSGALLVGIVGLKGAALIVYLGRCFRTASDRSSPGLRLWGMVWLAGFSLLAPLCIWVWQAHSAAGDEVRYLLIAHSLARHGTVDVSGAVANQEYRAFYTGAWHPAMSWSVKRAGTHAFHLLLAPAYLAGGRLGVMLLMAAIAALAAVGLLLWLWGSGLSPPAAGAAMLLTFGAVPILGLSQHALPDVPGLLLFVAGLLLLQRFEQAPLKTWLGLLAIALGLLMLKNRLGFLGLGLLLAGAVEQWVWFGKNSRGRAWLWAALAVVLGAALAWVLYRSDLLLWDITRWWPVYLERWAAADDWWIPIGVFLGGMGLDQEHGILLLAPIFLLALAGLPAACVRLPAPARQALIPVLFYMAIICFLRWDRFFGGNGPPGRFIAVVLPACALFIGFAWQHLQRRAWRVAPMLLGGLTLLWGLALTLIPSAQFHRTTGMNKLLGLVGRWWGHDVHHLFPSSFSAAAWWCPWLVGGALMVLVLGWAIWRNSGQPPIPRTSWRPWELSLAVAVVLLGVAGLLGLAKALPPQSLEAEQMAGKGASLYGVVAGGAKPVGRSLISGGEVDGRLYHPGNERHLVVVGHCGAPGRVSLTVDGRPAGNLPCSKDKELIFSLPRINPGYMQLGLQWRSCPDKRCYLLIDRLELRKADKPSQGGG